MEACNTRSQPASLRLDLRLHGLGEAINKLRDIQVLEDLKDLFAKSQGICTASLERLQ